MTFGAHTIFIPKEERPVIMCVREARGMRYLNVAGSGDPEHTFHIPFPTLQLITQCSFEDNGV